MIQVTLTFNTIAAAAAALAAMGADVQVGAISGPVQTPKGAAGNGKTPAPSPTTAPAPSPTSSPAPSPSPAPAASADTAQGELSYEKDVKPIVIKVGAAGKRDNLVELLKKFNVAKGPEVPADKLPAFKAELEALLA